MILRRQLAAFACTAALAWYTTAGAQQAVAVSVDISKPLNPVTQASIGVYEQVGDTEALTAQTIGMLRSAGFSAFTFPTGWESAADLYHWSTNSFTPHAGNADLPRKPYAAAGNDFGHLVLAFDKTGGTPIIQVNYGSNSAGTGGGEPKEAAAWVAYANGAAESQQVIGVDSTGKDWKTVGYWATLRASMPLSTDDGFNFLRVNHPAPLHIQLWQVGEDEAENGYYGGEHKGSFDLHAPYPASAQQNERRKKLRELSPAFYGERVTEFADAMKAVDPKVQVGASLTTPTLDTWAPDWNSEVLKTACKAIDFVSYPWHPGKTLPPDWKTLDDSSVLSSPQDQFPQIITETLYQDRRFCPSGKVPHVMLSQMSPIPWATLGAPVIKALFAADAYATLVEAGISSAVWYQLRDNGVTSDQGKLTPAYYGAQMFHIVAFRPGDALLKATGGSSTLSVHAARRQDGLYGVMLINKDPHAALRAKLSLPNASLVGSGLKFVYGTDQATKGTGPEREEIKVEDNSITLDLPPYSIVDVILPIKK